MRKLMLALAVVLLVTGVASAESPQPMPAHTMVMPDQIQWGPAPAGLPPGSKAAVLSGNPGAAEPFTLRAWLPKGYKVPPHWHSTAENLTVLSGRLRVGHGDTLAPDSATALGPGAYVVMPAEMRHWVVAESDTVLQVHGVGPFAITYVNPDDDPRQAMPKDE